VECDIGAIRKAVSGDSDSFVQITDGIKEKLYFTAYAILSIEADAIDALDETMYSAWRSIHTLREPKYFSTWITKILINKCLRTLKRHKRETVTDIIECPAYEYFDSLPIRQAVTKLPDELRIIISLRFFSDMTVPDIAGLLSLPQGTVKTRQRKALSLLRIELEEN
jgi:RNA polymerase sigma-70 factor (ECF subfamily)